jgi:ethylbenzene dioxygenase subunit beta
MSLNNIHDIEAFLFTEAKLLDQKKFDDWFSLFSDDAYYWIPLRPEQSQPEKELSIIYDDIDMMKARIHWLNHPKNHAQAIPSRTVHYVSNVLIENFNDNDQEYSVSSALQVSEFRKAYQTIYSGRCEYVLRVENDALKIVSKRVDLINSEAVLNSISIPL